MGEGEMRIFVLRWNLNGTWKGVTQESWELNAGDTRPGWRWDANLCTLMEVRWYTDGVYTSILGFGFLWDVTWMEVRRIYRDLHWDELRPGWMWDINIKPGLYNLDPPPSRWQITSIKVPKLHLSSTQYPYQCHPGLISLQVLSHIHLGSCLNSKHVSSDLHHGP